MIRWQAILRVISLSLWLGAVLVACPMQPSKPSPQPSRSATVPLPSTSSVVPIPTVPDAGEEDPADSAPEVIDAAASDAVVVDDFGSKGAAPAGKVQCGKQVCRADVEICCAEGLKSLGCRAPYDLNGERIPYCDNSMTQVGFSCDDSSDCPRGQICCLDAQASTASWIKCSKPPCVFHQACRLPNGKCPRGYHCARTKPLIGFGSEKLFGRCRPNSARKRKMTCGKGQRCTADQFCYWNNEQRTGRCGKPGLKTDGLEVSALTCRSPADCGRGYSCCAGMMGGSYCSSFCPMYHGVQLCESIRDCRPDFPHGPKAKACAADASYRWLPTVWKRCVFTN